MKLNLATDNVTWHATRNSCDRKTYDNMHKIFWNVDNLWNDRWIFTFRITRSSINEILKDVK
jgi:hypothetical protein